jgi:hypothetical protein
MLRLAGTRSLFAKTFKTTAKTPYTLNRFERAVLTTSVKPARTTYEYFAIGRKAKNGRKNIPTESLKGGENI